jgi:hypothetical protein
MSDSGQTEGVEGRDGTRGAILTGIFRTISGGFSRLESQPGQGSPFTGELPRSGPSVLPP